MNIMAGRAWEIQKEKKKRKKGQTQGFYDETDTHKIVPIQTMHGYAYDSVCLSDDNKEIKHCEC